MAFEKVTLKNGELRADYIKRRTAEGAGIVEITRELNSPDLYSGRPGGKWTARNLFQTIARKTAPKVARRDEPVPDAVLSGDEPAAVAVASSEPDDDVPEKFRGKLTSDEYREIVERAKKKASSEAKDAAMKEALAFETQKARETVGLVARKPDDPGDDLVSITVQVADCMNLPYIALSGKKYWHGQTYELPRHIAADLRWIGFQTFRHADEIEGRKKNRQLSNGRFVDGATGASPSGSRFGTIGGIA